MTFAVGDSFRQYRILEVLGSGGMGEVFRARDAALDRAVAIKILRADLLGSAEAIARFDREARIASSLDHPGIAKLYESGVEANHRFMIMEYVEGQDLAGWLRSRPRLGAILDVLVQVGEAVAHAHAAGILHRDLKPANVRVGDSGVKLLDFGVASIQESFDSEADTAKQLTSPGGVVGSLAYMSPEQARSRALDVRSDTFSLGVLIYECVAGRHPFRASSSLESAAAVLHDDPMPRLRKQRGIPPALVALLTKALDKDPERRYQHVEDLLVDLRAVRRSLEAGSDPGRGLGPLVAGLAAGLAVAALGIGRIASNDPLLPAALRPGARIRPLTTRGLSRDPSLSLDGARVCYASDAYGSWDIVLQDFGSGHVVRVTDDPGDELEPALSPDGQTIAYCTGDGRIQVVPSLGGTPRTLAEGAKLDHVVLGAPTWSPDGQRICYRKEGRLHVVNRSGGASRVVTTEADPTSMTGATWSSDGRWLVYTGMKTGRFVLARVAAGGGETSILGEGSYALGWPSLTDSDRWLLGTTGPPRTDGGSLWAMPLSEGQAGSPRRLLGISLNTTAPRASKDGRRVVFGVAANSIVPARITLDAGSLAPAALMSEPEGFQSNVSHDGHRIAMVNGRLGTFNVWGRTLAGSPLEPLREGAGNDENPAWSPDDTRIAMAHFEHELPRIGVIPASGGPLTYVSEPGRSGRFPCWSPDGRQLAFVSAEGAASDIRIASAEGGPARVVARSAARLGRLSWSADGLIAVELLSASGAGIGVVPAVGGSIKEVLGEARVPLHLPGGRLAFLRRSGSLAYDVWLAAITNDGTVVPGSEQRLTHLARSQTIEDDPLSYDGQFLYVSLGQLTRSELWLAEAP
jgi:Tol biopolymer transport system component/predicted Ser/Thr protein kinase